MYTGENLIQRRSGGGGGGGRRQQERRRQHLTIHARQHTFGEIIRLVVLNATPGPQRLSPQRVHRADCTPSLANNPSIRRDHCVSERNECCSAHVATSDRRGATPAVGHNITRVMLSRSHLQLNMKLHVPCSGHSPRGEVKKNSREREERAEKQGRRSASARGAVPAPQRPNGSPKY